VLVLAAPPPRLPGEKEEVGEEEGEPGTVLLGLKVCEPEALGVGDPESEGVAVGLALAEGEGVTLLGVREGVREGVGVRVGERVGALVREMLPVLEGEEPKVREGVGEEDRVVLPDKVVVPLPVRVPVGEALGVKEGVALLPMVLDGEGEDGPPALRLLGLGEGVEGAINSTVPEVVVLVEGV
jgi:hypothetical protein